MSKAKNKPKSPDTSNQTPNTKLTWLPKKTFELELTIPWKKAKEAYDEALKEAARGVTLKGFRKAKAPLALVEKSLDKGRLYEETLRKLLPETYLKAVKKHQLNPITTPKIQPISLKEKEEWRFKVTACERPEIKLGDYKQIIKGELAKEKIWTPARQSTLSETRLNKPTWSIKGGGGPDKNKPKKKAEEASPEKKINLVTKTLLESIKVEVPEILVEQEVNRMLAQLLDQINALGMTIEAYLASKGQSAEQLRENYQRQAEETLKLEFILQEIVRTENIKVENEEVEKMIKAIPDEKSRQRFDNPQEKAYIKLLLAKRKAIDTLSSL